MKRLLLFFLLLISIPIFITNFFYEYASKKYVAGIINNKKETNNIKIRVLKKDNTIESYNLEDYLIGVVSSEMPITFEEEALKAQAVASRTYALKQMENNKDKNYDVTDDIMSQVFSTNDELKEKWRENYDNYYNKIKNIVEDTRGEYLSYNDEIIYAFFFSTSNGKTEDNKDVFGADLPYLKVVDSSFDETESPSFFNTYSFSKEEFYSNLGIDYSDRIDIKDIIKTDSGRVKSITINNNIFKGRDFQKKLTLKSNDFTIKDGDNIVIETKGNGHGVGLSQYGANSLAKSKKTYKEILKYYYVDTELKKL